MSYPAFEKLEQPNSLIHTLLHSFTISWVKCRIFLSLLLRHTDNHLESMNEQMNKGMNVSLKIKEFARLKLISLLKEIIFQMAQQKHTIFVCF